ncbi:hypothetical protein ES703_93240 [subsurface metagenome]|nr:hypothetical protein [bacterium]
MIASSKAHSELTGIGINDHHDRNHAATHHSGGADALTFASIAGFGTYLDQAVKQASSVIFGGAVINGKFTLGTPTELTIAGGAITVTRSNHEVDTQGDAGTDNLDTINGFTDGMILVLKAKHPARTVVVRDGVGNIELEGGVNMELDNMAKKLYLFYDDGTVPRWYEISRFNG